MRLDNFPQQFKRKRTRPVERLGKITDGGIVDAIQHIGVTSVSGLAGSACMDIGWPPHMRLDLPRRQVHAHRDEQFIDFLLADRENVWRYRRNPIIFS